VVQTLNAEIVRILHLPEMKTRLAELGAEPAALKPEEFLAFIRRDNARWEKVIKARGLEIDRPVLKL
jgi:tripartite-type tricarboxylate transporter receptor subunit TctC